MESSSKTARDLIHLVSCAVIEKKPNTDICKEMDLEAVYYLAQFHSLTSAAAFALEKVTELPRAFISGDELKKNYPTVYKHKVLYPLLFVYRPIKGAVTRPKGLIDEVKDVKKFKNRNK